MHGHSIYIKTGKAIWMQQFPSPGSYQNNSQAKSLAI